MQLPYRPGAAGTSKKPTERPHRSTRATSASAVISSNVAFFFFGAPRPYGSDTDPAPFPAAVKMLGQWAGRHAVCSNLLYRAGYSIR